MFVCEKGWRERQRMKLIAGQICNRDEFGFYSQVSRELIRNKARYDSIRFVFSKNNLGDRLVNELESLMRDPY